MINIILSLVCLSCISMFDNSAYATKKDGVVCKPTPQSFDNFEPEIFPKSNNLLRSPGGVPAKLFGEKIVIRGKIVDENCVPVIDAKVFAWQRGGDGKYHYTPLKNIAKDSNLIADKSTSSFVGAGSTSTDNKGEFYFITYMPPNEQVEKNAFISIRVEHKEFDMFETRLIFQKGADEATPPEFITFALDPTQGKEAKEFMITLPGRSKIRSF
ncbi:MAG: dioxygenase [Chlamydiae bacterium]|nr:dioxygenase [Chlamydiota bacterium]